MNENFVKVFSGQPDSIVNGDYFFKTDFQQNNAKLVEIRNMTPEKYRKMTQGRIREQVLQSWATRGLDVELEEAGWESSDRLFAETVRRIAADGKPVLDLASSVSMGIIPYLLKCNPSLVCLVSDVESDLMECLRTTLGEELPDLYVDIASFDNNAIPIHDGMLDWITSIHAIASSVPRDHTREISFECCSPAPPALAEVYRILKPGGHFVTIEPGIEVDIDVSELEMDDGFLFGVFTSEDVMRILPFLKEESWEDKFTKTGFNVLDKSRYIHRYTEQELKIFLYRFTYFNGLREWSGLDVALLCISPKSVEAIREAKTKAALARWIRPIGRFSRIENGALFAYTQGELLDAVWENRDSPLFSAALDAIENQKPVGGLALYRTEELYVLQKDSEGMGTVCGLNTKTNAF